MTGLPALLGALGLVGVCFGLLSFLLALFGAPTDLVWIVGNLLVGFLLLLTSAALGFEALRERMTSGEARRAGKYGTSALLSTLLLIVMVGTGGWFANRYHVRFDWTEQKVHSLSDQTLQVLAGLEENVEVLALYSPLDAAPVRELLDKYAYESERFVVAFEDPAARPDLLERYAIGPEKLNPGVVRLALSGESVEVEEVTEQNLTNAMVKISRTEKKRIYVLIGHNERPVEGEDGAARDGYGRAADALRNENYEVETLLLAATGSVPEDADALLIPGPTRPLLDVEHEALRSYFASGGAVVTLIDPRAKTDLVDLVAEWGVDLGDDIIVDRSLALFGRATAPFARSFADHEITRKIPDIVVFNIVRSVQSGSTTGADFTELVFTGESSWAESDLDQFYSEGTAELGDDDIAGPVSVAVAGRPAVDSLVEDEAADAPRLVVFGDADFASNEFIDRYGNRDLFVNAVNWSLGDVEAISIRPNIARASRFALSTQQFQRIRSLSLFVLPEGIAVIGVLTWWSRRRASVA